MEFHALEVHLYLHGHVPQRHYDGNTSKDTNMDNIYRDEHELMKRKIIEYFIQVNTKYSREDERRIFERVTIRRSAKKGINTKWLPVTPSSQGCTTLKCIK